MPTPLQILMDPVTLTVLALYGALITWESLAPARKLPPVQGWRLRGLVSFLAFLVISAYLPIFWADWLAPLRLFDLAQLGAWTGAALGVLLYELGAWAWHRSLHGSNTLWRFSHQWHHSAERLDTYGAFWFSPLDMIGWTALSSLCLAGLIGLSPHATFAATAFVTFLTIFQHTNVRTPRWLGYIVQRPESHSWHHARGVHAKNYSDLPLFDLLFGTLNNPRDFAPQQGFHDGGSTRLADMLRGRDVASTRPAQKHPFHQAMEPLSPCDP